MEKDRCVYFDTEFFDDTMTFDTGIVDKTVEVQYENDYSLLENKPSINSTTLIQGLDLKDIGVQSLSNYDLENLLKF